MAAKRIFISYARRDGAALAARIRARLEAENLGVWQDLPDMQPGRDFWLQIEAVLRDPGLEHLILVLTPAAIASGYVRDEWRLARAMGVQVTPVYDRDNRPDLASLPNPMRKADRLDPEIDEHWRKLLRTVEGPSTQVRVPFMAEDLRPGFVPRPEPFRQIRDALLGGDGNGVAITTALRGAGGFGKTSLARAVCHDSDIGEAFDNGIFWTTLGEKPVDLVSRINAFSRALDPKADQPSHRDQALAQWRRLIELRRCLIVIDDVWRRSDLEPFLDGGPLCARLVTTRDTGTLPRGQGQALPMVEVDRMTPAEAVTLLSRGNEAAAGNCQAELAGLSERLGHWALLLDLAQGRMFAQAELGEPFPQVVAEAHARLDARGLTAFDARDEDERRRAVAGSLEISLEALTDRWGADAAARLIDLATFAEDAAIPEPLIAALWQPQGLDRFETGDLLIRLHQMSFLSDYDTSAATLRVHDTIRAWLQRRAGAPALVAVHGRIADAIQAQAAGGWDRAPDYGVAEIPAHLVASGRAAQADLLLQDPGWLGQSLTRPGAGFGAAATRRAMAAVATSPVSRALARIVMQAGDLMQRLGPDHVIPQLLARLAPEIGPDAAALRTTLRQQATGPALLPRFASILATDAESLRIEVGAEVNSVAISPDGQRLATGSDDATARVWDLASGQELLRLEGHERPVWSVAFSPDGQRFATGSDDNTARVWDLASGQELLRLVGHDDTVNSVAFSPDGQRLATGSDDHAARVWDLASGQELLRLKGHESWVRSIAFSPDGQRLATGSGDTTTRVWDLASGQELLRYEGHRGQVTSVAFSPDGQLLATGSADATARIWDLATGQERIRLEGHETWVRSVAFSLDGQRVATGSGDTTARVWELASGRELQRLQGHGQWVTSVAFCPDGHRLATASADNTIRVWDLATAQGRMRIEGHGRSVTSVAFSPDGQRLATGSWDKAARVWDLYAGQELRRLEGHGAPVASVAFSPDGQRLATGSDDNTARVWDLASGKELLRLEGHRRGVRSVAFSPDGQRLATGSDDHTARVWDLASGRELLRLEGHGDWVRSVAFSPDGQRVATGSRDITARVWDLATEQELLRLAGHGNRVNSVAFSPDGQHLATGSADYTARVWNLATGQELLRLEGHGRAVWSVAFSPDGQRLGTGSEDGNAKVWDLASGQAFAAFSADVRVVNAVAWSPDGAQIALGDDSGAWHLLEVLDAPIR